MFHNSTTLHHDRNLYSGSCRENRLAFELNWFAKKRLQSAVLWDYMRGPRKLARIYSWGFGWPLIKKGFDYTIQGMGKVADGVEWSTYAAIEAGKGAVQMAVSPMAMLAKSRLTMIKRMLWDVPIATASALIRTPIALAKAPIEMVRGVRDAIVSVPKNAGEILNSVFSLNVMDTLKNTRKLVTDALLPPISRPLMPVLAPAGHLVNTAAGAELQTLAVARQAITETVPQGFSRIMNAPATASATMAQLKAEREARAAALEKEQEEQRKALQAAIKENKGEGGGKGK